MRDERPVLHTQAASSSALSHGCVRLVLGGLRRNRQRSMRRYRRSRTPWRQQLLGDRQGAWAFSLLPGSTAHAVGANNGALAIGLNNTASSTVGTGNISTALGIGNAASSLIAGNGNWNNAVGLNNNASSTGLIGIGAEGDPLSSSRAGTTIATPRSALGIRRIGAWQR